jgi:structural maintenance of chromosome 1
VTVDGTIIHKSGNMTGGQGQSGGRKFDDKQVEALKRLKETYLNQLKELNQSKPKDKADEGLLQQLARLDAEHSIAKDDLVSHGRAIGGDDLLI